MTMQELYNQEKIITTRDKFLSKKGFTEEQKDQMEIGFENGLSIAQVSSYFKKTYTANQMQQARDGFENGLTKEQVAFLLQA